MGVVLDSRLGGFERRLEIAHRGLLNRDPSKARPIATGKTISSTAPTVIATPSSTKTSRPADPIRLATRGGGIGDEVDQLLDGPQQRHDGGVERGIVLQHQRKW